MNPDLLTLTQWLSPAFPLGSFAYSHGLETVVENGAVSDRQTLTDWIADILRFGTGHVDAILLCQSISGEDMADTARALAASKERLHESEAQGRAFVETVNGMSGAQAQHAPFPVAVGVAARGLTLAPQEVVSLYLHAFASNLVSVGVRFIPLGQTDGQKALAALHPVILEVAAQAATQTFSDMASAAFGADIAAMQHETQDVRIFKT
ncbi:urease accessory protein UreF [Falsihalocynthiibacter sp. S25ZX9]|uniref:urease accessory protein UreF n=1 Tax=Falsihalocynthiibacter sp. S25ZX9 TaxID=3240870 RepID=UPI00350E9247